MIILLLIPISLISQNLEDAYGNHKGVFHFQSNDGLGNYNGEYQVFLDKLYWEKDADFEDAAKSFSIQVVSFPFIPKELDDNDVNASSLHQETDRIFEVQLMTGYNYGYLDQSGNNYTYDGIGWQYGNWKIYSKINNSYTCESGPYDMCRGDYGLISAGFASPLSYNNYDDAWLPHTILKHTIYFHCGPEITDEIIDSLSWIYDNTRGSMRTYPFSDENGTDGLNLNDAVIDVCFRPTFIDASIFYTGTDSNNAFYDSGYPDNTGSVNYFPSEEVQFQYDICQGYPLYYNPNNPIGSYEQNYSTGTYSASYVHPPPYVLIDAPLLNADGNTWAGYDVSADTLPGIKHKYEINEDSIDLRLINPVQKIIYNPSYVEVNANLVFPCKYKFLTLHGKYPDKENEVLAYYNSYWANKSVYFPYERDYPTPVSYVTNKEYISIYKIKAGKTILIEPNVIIMDAIFIGNGALAFDPNHKLGNWQYDESTITVIQLDYGEMDCDYIIKPLEGDSLKDALNNLAQNKDVTNKELLNYLRIIGMNSGEVHFSIHTGESINNSLYIFNAYGDMIIQKQNPPEDYYLNTSGLSLGVYVALLMLNGEKTESLKFFLK
jgi:hypothetical protein